MRSFIIYLNFVSLLAVCLFACNHHSSNPMLQQVDSLLYLQPIITQYFMCNKSEIWSLSLIVHSKG